MDDEEAVEERKEPVAKSQPATIKKTAIKKQPAHAKTTADKKKKVESSSEEEEAASDAGDAKIMPLTQPIIGQKRKH